jgi:3-deoxy-D-arabino-heptulosonate 7-phosphate (DAHP) synthase
MFRIVESDTGITVEIAASRAAAVERSDWLTVTTRRPHHIVLTGGNDRRHEMVRGSAC